jgi:hypothetical protein
MRTNFAALMMAGLVLTSGMSAMAQTNGVPTAPIKVEKTPTEIKPIQIEIPANMAIGRASQSEKGFDIQLDKRQVASAYKIYLSTGPKKPMTPGDFDMWLRNQAAAKLTSLEKCAAMEDTAQLNDDTMAQRARNRPRISSISLTLSFRPLRIGLTATFE